MSERLTISIENDLSAECVDVLVEDSEGTLTISLHLIDGSPRAQAHAGRTRQHAARMPRKELNGTHQTSCHA